MRRVLRSARYAALVAALLISAYPVVWMSLTAFRNEGEVLLHPFGLPRGLTLENLRKVLASGEFGRAYRNSFLVCGSSVAAAVAGAAMAGFAFAKLRFPGKQWLFLLLLAGMMIPVHVTLIPLNRLTGPQFLNLKGTFWVLAGPYIGFALPVSTLILRSAFAQVPDELLEAARIDGCSNWGIFLHIALPLVRPALATVAIFNALTMWNEFAFALTLINNQHMRTLPLALWQFKGEHGMYIGQTCAALFVTVIPMLLVYMMAQRHIIQGLTAGAVKA